MMAGSVGGPRELKFGVSGAEGLEDLTFGDFFS